MDLSLKLSNITSYNLARRRRYLLVDLLARRIGEDLILEEVSESPLIDDLRVALHDLYDSQDAPHDVVSLL